MKSKEKWQEYDERKISVQRRDDFKIYQEDTYLFLKKVESSTLCSKFQPCSTFQYITMNRLESV